MNQEDHDLLIAINESTKGIPKWQEDHEKLDDKRFFWLFICILAVAASAGVIPQVLNHVKIGG